MSAAFCILQAIRNQATVLITVLAVSLSACIKNQSRVTTIIQPIAAANLSDTSQIEEAVQIEADDLAKDLEDYVGQRVRVRETVGKPVGDSAFLLTDYHLLGSQLILVFNASGVPFTVPPDHVVEAVLVTGEVRRFTIAEFERDYGIELDPDRYADYENLPALVAQSIVLAPDPDEVTKNPDDFYDQVIAVAGEIDDRLAPNVITLDEERFIGGEDLLVIGTTAIPFFEEDEDILALGVLRRFDTVAFEREYDLDWNVEVQQQIKAEFTDKPVLAAEAVYRAVD